MSLGSLLSLLIALAKVAPVTIRLADEFSAKWAEHRRTATHARIDQAIATAQRAPWECPAACPHRRPEPVDGLPSHRLQHAAEPGGSPAGPS